MPADELLTMDEVAETFRVAKSTVMRWGNKGEITPIRIGSTVRYRRDEIEALLRPEPKGATA